jgi:uncharacterized protein YPO0396
MRYCKHRCFASNPGFISLNHLQKPLITEMLNMVRVLVAELQAAATKRAMLARQCSPVHVAHAHAASNLAIAQALHKHTRQLVVSESTKHLRRDVLADSAAARFGAFGHVVSSEPSELVSKKRTAAPL